MAIDNILWGYQKDLTTNAATTTITFDTPCLNKILIDFLYKSNDIK
jgi:hypothetical protein